MSGRDQVISDLSALSDTVYFARDEDTANRQALNAHRSGFTGLALGAPKRVLISSSEQLPALLVSAETSARSAALPLVDNGMALAVDEQRGTILADEAFPGDPSKSPDELAGDFPPEETEDDDQHTDPSGPLAQLGGGNMTGTAWLDFKALLNVPWQQSDLVLRVISFDEISNPVRVQLAGDEIEPQQYSSDRATEIGRRAKVARDTQSYPRFDECDETPRLNSPGVELALGFDTPVAGQESLPVHGAIRVALSPYWIVEPANEAATKDQVLPSAVVPAAILVASENHDRPFRLDLEVPVWSDEELTPGDVASGALSVDLADVLPSRLPRGSYCVYLVCGPYLAGPKRMTLELGH